MADRTVRAIFEARVSGAQKGMRDLAKDVDGAGRKVDSLSKDLKGLDGQKVNPKIDLAIKDAERQIKDLTLQLGDLRTMEVTPEVTADIKKAERSLADAKKALRELNGAKAEMRVTADTSPAKREVAKLGDDIGDAGDEAGEDAGMGIASGIISALRTIPIAGAVIGVGVAIAGGILIGIKQGLQIEAERDIFSAQTGLDDVTSARFGRAAGEAYANAWGDSVAGNLDTAKMALRAGIINQDATDSVIEDTIAKLQGLSDLFDYDISMSVRAVGNAMKTGLVKDAEQAFDFITKASQQVPSDDLLDTLNEYSSQFVQMGITGVQAFGLLAQGAKAGARDTDNVADAMKEINLRVGEGSKAVNEALELLGLRGDIMGRAFNKGGIAAAKATDLILDRLRALREKGGNTQEVIANLFGGPGEDLGAALYALDLDTAAAALDGVDGAAGAADRALTTLGDNTATKMESARRNVEIAMDGIKGALAEAFSEEIGGAADWVSKNRAPLMQFFLDVINGTFAMANAFVGFSVEALFQISELATGLADFIESIPFVDDALADGLRNVADSAGAAAVEISQSVPGALDEAQRKANEWALPEILKARVHDATLAMAGDLEEFAEKIAETDAEVTINGNKMNAEQVLAELTENINAEDGTVTIDGDKVPAEEALDAILTEVENGNRDITVGADTTPGKASLGALKGLVSLSEAAITVTADTAAAEARLNALERTRYATLQIRVAGVTGQGGLTKGAHDGGWTGVLPGKHAGGRVPGTDPGYDNILWPLNSGGRTLQQPLAGGEYVVNSKDAAYWAPVLEMMNAGQRPTSHAVTHDSSLTAQQVTIVTPDANSFKREFRTVPYKSKARPGRDG